VSCQKPVNGLRHNGSMPATAPAPPGARPPSGPQKALAKLGLQRPIDLALHLPLRYEDETRLVKAAVRPHGRPAPRGRRNRRRPGPPVPMHRLLQGDVGSGKTVVAALAACLAMDAGWQCALMAPTEILAEQHFAKMIGWLEPCWPHAAAWLVGGQKKKERTAMLALVASGEAALVVGTHAVIQEQVQFKNLALAIIDEQHRFGVAQRLALRQKLAARHGAAHADDERHAHSAHAGHELLRRPGCVGHRRVAARAHAHRHQADRRQPQGRGDRAHRRAGGPGGRCTGCAR
jgi:hypothetical protein